ncbi:M24 family metallopeptidase [Deinococcus frigens]|uniref:M24 family metallopeptidase n=1 Tax=Deinococcus frigens TaxID=249403 RepID=UPI00049645E9|nr:M24 family metallopeptidase [Deinococcus frigens]
MTRAQEVETKLAWVREALAEAGSSLCRLRGSDWFAWATAGGSSTVLMTAETGAAEVIVGTRDAFVLTDHIEAGRLRAEQLGGELVQVLPVRAVPWGNPDAWEAAALAAVQPGGPVLSDRPGPAEEALPEALLVRRRTLLPAELARFRQVGRAAAEAVTGVLLAATPQMTELELAALAGAALRRRGLDDALVLVAGQRRLPLYRHPTPQEEVLGNVAMLVVCARGHGLVASLTRFVSFGPLPDAARAAHARVRAVEAAVLAASVPGMRLLDLYDVLAGAYRDVGDPGAMLEHHQGGLAGYQAREAIATPGTATSLNVGSVLAWNPSVRGAKIEDTIALTGVGLEVLTLDPAWPQATVAGLPRPLVMERTRP